MKALDTIFYALNAGQVLSDIENKGVLFLNALDHQDIPRNAHLVQWFKPAYDKLSSQFSDVYADINSLDTVAADKSFDLVLLLYPKAHKEALYWLSQALIHAKDGADIAIAGDNDAGGKRIAKDLKALGIAAEHVSKYKARAALFKKPAILSDEAQALLSQYQDYGGLTLDKKTCFWTMPGIFGWQKVDSGSQLLIETLNSGTYDRVIKGVGADFGCGYGYLSCSVLNAYDGITALHAIDADYRSVEASKKNLSDCGDRVQHHWHDLAVSSPVSRLNWVVMNPPFHESKDYAVYVGESFIRHAAKALQPEGHLLMVANAHLPYEKVLNDVFKSYETITTAKGFKVIHARR